MQALMTERVHKQTIFQQTNYPTWIVCAQSLTSRNCTSHLGITWHQTIMLLSRNQPLFHIRQLLFNQDCHINSDIIVSQMILSQLLLNQATYLHKPAHHHFIFVGIPDLKIMQAAVNELKHDVICNHKSWEQCLLPQCVM